jgi:hypothetical protein
MDIPDTEHYDPIGDTPPKRKRDLSHKQSTSPVHSRHAYQNKSPPRTIRPTLAYRMHREPTHDEDLAERSGCAEKAQADTAPTGEIVRE